MRGNLSPLRHLVIAFIAVIITFVIVVVVVYQQLRSFSLDVVKVIAADVEVRGDRCSHRVHIDTAHFERTVRVSQITDPAIDLYLTLLLEATATSFTVNAAVLTAFRMRLTTVRIVITVELLQLIPLAVQCLDLIGEELDTSIEESFIFICNAADRCCHLILEAAV